MSDNKKGYSRRDALRIGVQSAVGLQAGLNVAGMTQALLPKVGPFDKIQQIFSKLDCEKAMAQTQELLSNPIIQFVIIDKWQEATVVATDGVHQTDLRCTQAGTPDQEVSGNTCQGQDLPGFNGLAGQTALMYRGVDISGKAISTLNFRGMQLTALFGEILAAEMNDNYSLALLPQFTSERGGHNLNTTNLGDDLGGVNYFAEQKAKSTGLLGAVGFAMSADANNSREAFLSKGNLPMQAYDSVASLLRTLRGAVASLYSGERVLDFRKKLDLIANERDKSLSVLQGIKQLTDAAIPALQSATTAPDVVEQQVRACIALAKSGLASNFSVAVPWDDTNTGNSLTNGGGQFGINPYTGVCMIANALALISKELPNAICFSVSDGGRDRRNGDAAGTINFLTGPKALINNGMFGVAPRLRFLGDGNRNNDASAAMYQMSKGEPVRMLRHQHLLSLVLKLIGIDSGVEYPVGVVNGAKISDKV